ncbi:MAG: glycine reductase [Tissierellia bacterium]|nr:glycine reductase [Tissierellia bacterium]
MSKQKLAEVLLETSQALLTGNFGTKSKIGLVVLGSEHGANTMIEAAKLAKDSRFEIVLLGTDEEIDGIKTIKAVNPDEAHKIMEELLDSNELDACVTMHYDFPIGVATVGRVITPGRGKEMIISATTGVTATDRVEAMVKNAIIGIVAAKSIGIENPTLGILNIEGARQTEQILKQLQENGYPIAFADSMRADKGMVMRGNDLLHGSCDIMVADSLTGNLMLKIFSSFTTGGDYESLGYGYGPGVGEGYKRKVFIVSRASGIPVVANAIKYAYETVAGNIEEKTTNEFAAAKKAGLDNILRELHERKAKTEATVEPPAKEIVTKSIGGIEIMDLDDAVSKLWSVGIYAESGMGCTGPVVMVNEKNIEKALEIMKEAKFI